RRAARKVRSESSIACRSTCAYYEVRSRSEPCRGKCSAQALQLADRRAAGAVAACVPPSHRSASCNAGASPTIQRSRRDRDNEAVLSRAVHPNGGLVVQSGARSLRHRDAIISLAARYKLPAVYSARDYASVGGLLSYGPDQIGH